ncbi:MAG: hypothetical protein H0W06_12310 [Chloroflexia bacterium]|nr:hypothetical protein [Chloroflexia bacterium]
MGNRGNAYAESVERDLRGHLNGLVTGSLSLQGFQQWLMDNETLIEDRASPELYDDVVQVEHILAEYTGGHIAAAVAIAEIARATGERIEVLPRSNAKARPTSLLG